MDKTLKLLTKSLKNDPQDWETRRHLIDCHLEADDTAAAVNLVREAPNVPSEDNDLLTIVRFLASNDPFSALGFAERAVMTDAGRGAAHYAKGIACDAINQPDQAAQHKGVAIQLNPGLSALGGAAVVETEPAHVTPSAPEPAVAVPAEPVIDEVVSEPVIEEQEIVPEQIVVEEPIIEEAVAADVEPVYEPSEVPISAGFVPAAELAEMPTIQPLVNPNDLPELVALPTAEVNSDPTRLEYTTPDELEVTRSHLLVPTPEGEFIDADEYAEQDEAEMLVESGLVVAPAGVAPEAQEENRTKAKVSAILMTLLVHVALFALVALIIVAAPRMKPPEIVASTVPVSQQESISKKKVVQQQPKQPSAPPAPSVSAITALSATSPTSIPNVTFDAVSTSMDMGSTMGAGLSFGVGGDFGAGLPMTMKSRCSSAERTSLLRKHGGDSKVAKAVKKSLEYLKATQNEDGSWGDHHKGAMTGVALLAYLGHCETPDSPQYGDTVMQGIMYLVELSNKNNGLLAAVADKHYPYEHGIATYALGETYALAKFGKRQLPGVRDAFETGVRIIIDGQVDNGGWTYGYDPGGRMDTSVSGWQYQALKAAKHTNLKIGGLSAAIKKSESSFKDVMVNKGHYQYGPDRSLSEASDWNMTGVAVLGYQMLGDPDRRKDEIDDGIKYLFEHEEKHGVNNVYGWYYATQVMFQKGGDAWKRWNEKFKDPLVTGQLEDGSWPPGGRATTDLDKKIYRSALNTLMLEVYFRYLPAAG